MLNKKQEYFRLIELMVFGIAMAFLESSIVIYLRKVYYPEGFGFPLHFLDTEILKTEIIREAATMVMILFVARIVYKSFESRFAVFLLLFGIWDIFYYVFLYLLISWPSSLLEWDVLFLIPLTWTGPVLAPIINSACMILIGLIIIKKRKPKDNRLMGKWVWLLLISGSALVLWAYMEDYTSYLVSEYRLKQLFNAEIREELLAYAIEYIPTSFAWEVFLSGLLLHIFAIILLVTRQKA